MVTEPPGVEWLDVLADEAVVVVVWGGGAVVVVVAGGAVVEVVRLVVAVDVVPEPADLGRVVLVALCPDVGSTELDVVDVATARSG